MRSRSDPEAFAEFYDAYSQRVLVFLARRLLDAEVALDLTSETFAKALEHRHQFRGRHAEEEQAWLFAIARSELYRYVRRGRFEREALTRVGVEVPALNDAELERIEDLAGIRAVVAELAQVMLELPADQLEAVRLRVVDELGYEEIAARLAVTPVNARARVSRGLRFLASTLHARGIYAEDLA